MRARLLVVLMVAGLVALALGLRVWELDPQAPAREAPPAGSAGAPVVLEREVEAGRMSAVSRAAPAEVVQGAPAALHRRGTTVAVRVIDELGVPCANVEVARMRRAPEGAARAELALIPPTAPPPVEAAARTDADGRAEFAEVSSGVHWIGVRPVRKPWDVQDDGALAPVARRIVLAPDDERRDVLLRTCRGLYVRGRVEVPEGSAPEAAARVVLIAHAVDTGGGLTGDVADDGRFALGPVTDCAYRLETFGGDFAPIEPRLVRASDGPIVIRLEAGARISGRVVDAGSRAGAACEVVLTRIGGDEAEVLGSSDDLGAFAFGGLAPGLYAVSAFTRDGRIATSRAASVAIDAPLCELELPLAPVEQCAQVRVVLEGEIEPGRVGLWSNGICRAAAFVDGPRACTLAAQPGELDVRLFAGPAFVERRAVRTEAGATAEVRITR